MKYILFVSLIAMFSCKNENIAPQASKSIFEGFYQNIANEPEFKFSPKTPFFFSSNLKPFGYKSSPKMDSLSRFEIKLIDKKIMTIIVNQQNYHHIVKLKYKIENDTLCIYRNRYSEGVPLIYHRYRHIEIKLYFDKKKNLVAEYDGEGAGGILIVYFGGRIGGEYSFKKL
jgi:hypothetical protein